MIYIQKRKKKVTEINTVGENKNKNNNYHYYIYIIFIFSQYFLCVWCVVLQGTNSERKDEGVQQEKREW